MTKKATLTAVADRVTRSREEDLRQMLEERRRDILTEVQGRVRGVRTDTVGRPHDGMDQGEAGEAHVRYDIEFALIQMKAEMLTAPPAGLLQFPGSSETASRESADTNEFAFPPNQQAAGPVPRRLQYPLQ